MKFAAIILAVFPTVSMAGNYATCLLKNLPGLQNEAAARAAINLCMSEYPGGINSVPQGDGRGFLGYDSGAECAMKKAGETRSQVAGNGIYMACNRLYNEPVKPWLEYQANPFDKFDPAEKAPPVAPAPFKNATTQPHVRQESKVKSGPTWYEQQEKRRKCNIQPVMTDAEIAACR